MAKKNVSQTLESEAQPQYQAGMPNPDLRSLDRLVGTWKVSDPSGKGGAAGQVTYEWVEGGFFSSGSTSTWSTTGTTTRASS